MSAGDESPIPNGTLPEPSVGRPSFPPLFGVARGRDGLLAWPDVVARLEAASSYWIATQGPAGPHAAPVWGMWLADGLHFGTPAETTTGRNLAREPRAAVHLESADDVVIVKGRVGPGFVDERVADASERKYGHRPDLTPPGDEGLFRLRPRLVVAWRVAQLGRTATRFDFPSGPSAR